MDPGLRHCGVAIFYQKTLIWAALIVNPIGKSVRDEAAWEAMAKAIVSALQKVIVGPLYISQFAYENPQDYKGQGFKAQVKPDDIRQLRGVNSTTLKALREAFGVKAAQTTWYHPLVWKRTVKKEVMTNRIIGRLSPEELASVVQCAPSLMHNTYDGVGVGLHHVGRKLV